MFVCILCASNHNAFALKAPPNTAGGAYCTPPHPLARDRVGGGSLPSQEPYPTLGLWPQISVLRVSGVRPLPHRGDKFLARPLCGPVCCTCHVVNYLRATR